jgi:hypothetical protein
MVVFWTDYDLRDKSGRGEGRKAPLVALEGQKAPLLFHSAIRAS